MSIGSLAPQWPGQLPQLPQPLRPDGGNIAPLFTPTPAPTPRMVKSVPPGKDTLITTLISPLLHPPTPPQTYLQYYLSKLELGKNTALKLLWLAIININRSQR